MALSPYDAIQDGTSMDAVDVQQIIDGLTGSRNVAHTLVSDSSPGTALTLKNTHATGKALAVLDNSGATTFEIRRAATYDDAAQYREVLEIRPPGSIEFSNVADAPRPPRLNSYFDMNMSDSYAQRVMEQLIYENNSSFALTNDVATTAILGIQRTGDSYFRTMEMDMIAVTGSSALPKLGLELSIQANHLGNNIDRTVGIAVNNLGTIWGLATPQIVDTGVLVQGKNAGFVNYFAARDTSDTTVFTVGTTGIVQARGLVPTADSTYDIGLDSPVAWRTAYVDKYVATTDGDQANPIFTRLGDLNNGVFFPGTDAFAITTSGTEAVRVTSTGILDFRRAATQIVALGGGSSATNGTIGGSGPSSAGAAGWLKLQSAGSNIFVQYWV